MKRIFDLFFGVILLLSLLIVMLVISIVIRLTSKGPSLYWSNRVGKNNKILGHDNLSDSFLNIPSKTL